MFKVNKAYQKQYSDKTRYSKNFTIGQEAIIHNFHEDDKWICGKIVGQLGPVLYLVQCTDDAMWKDTCGLHSRCDCIPRTYTDSQLATNQNSLPDQDNLDSASDATFPSIMSDSIELSEIHQPEFASPVSEENVTEDASSAKTVSAPTSS